MVIFMRGVAASDPNDVRVKKGAAQAACLTIDTVQHSKHLAHQAFREGESEVQHPIRAFRCISTIEPHDYAAVCCFHSLSICLYQVYSIILSASSG